MPVAISLDETVAVLVIIVCSLSGVAVSVLLIDPDSASKPCLDSDATASGIICSLSEDKFLSDEFASSVGLEFAVADIAAGVIVRFL